MNFVDISLVAGTFQTPNSELIEFTMFIHRPLATSRPGISWARLLTPRNYTNSPPMCGTRMLVYVASCFPISPLCLFLWFHCSVHSAPSLFSFHLVWLPFFFCVCVCFLMQRENPHQQKKKRQQARVKLKYCQRSEGNQCCHKKILTKKEMEQDETDKAMCTLLSNLPHSKGSHTHKHLCRLQPSLIERGPIYRM